MDKMMHGHIPYFVILVQALMKYREQYKKSNPITSKDKSDFKDIIKKMKKYEDELNFEEALSYYYLCNADQNKLLTDKLIHIFDVLEKNNITDLLNKSNDVMKVFFIYARSLKEYYTYYNTLPLVGNIPDMTADTQSFINLKRIYQEKSNIDKIKIKEIIDKVLKELAFDDKDRIINLINYTDKDASINFIDVLNKNWPQISLFVYPNHTEEKYGKNLSMDDFDEDFQK